MKPSRRNQDKVTEGAALSQLMAGINRAEFARRHKLDASMIGQNIKGLRPISRDYAFAYARGLGVPVAEISPYWAVSEPDIEIDAPDVVFFAPLCSVFTTCCTLYVALLSFYHVAVLHYIHANKQGKTSNQLTKES